MKKPETKSNHNDFNETYVSWPGLELNYAV